MKRRTSSLGWLILLCLMLSVTTASSADQPESQPGLLALDMAALGDARNIIPQLRDTPLVFIGESHDVLGHHQAQLELLRLLFEDRGKVALGLEMFQRPFQPQLDAYIAGEISDRELLIRTEWFERWSYDFRHYRPILHYARNQGIPIIALNASSELTERISEVGVEGLTATERSQLPADLDSGDAAYRERLNNAYQHHDMGGENGFERFVQVQLAWDETMADGIADWMRQNPDGLMVVLAGAGHLRYRSGIPSRVKRRSGVEGKILLPDSAAEMVPGVADFILYPPTVTLPNRGMLGIFMKQVEGGVEIERVVSGGAAEQAGLRKGDWILQMDNVEVSSPVEVRIALIDRQPGDEVQLKLRRDRLILGATELQVSLKLGQ